MGTSTEKYGHTRKAKNIKAEIKNNRTRDEEGKGRENTEIDGIALISIYKAKT